MDRHHLYVNRLVKPKIVHKQLIIMFENQYLNDETT